MAGAMVLHKFIRMEDVASDLVAPLGGYMLTLQPLLFLRSFLQLQFDEACPEHGHGQLSVLELGALVLAGHHDARGKVCQAYSGRIPLNALAAVASRAEGVDTEVV